MSVKKPLRIMILGLSTIILLFFGRLIYQEYDRTYCPSIIRKSEITLPEYKNMKQIITKREVKNGAYYMKEFEFTTVDAPEVVLSFYKDALQKSGWKLVTQTNNLLSLDEKRGLPIYGVTFYISSSENLTHVDVQFSYSPCLYY